MKDVFYPENYQNVVKGQPVVVGQKVYCGLYGGNYGIVIAIHGEQKPASIGSICGIMATGGNAKFDIVFDNHVSHMLPECILHGVQWKIFPDVASAEDIAIAKKICEESIAAAKAKEKADAARREAERAKHLEDNPGLIPYANSNMSPGKCAAKNIRIELKAHFKGIKFSVKSDYNSVNISWDFGPTAKEVEAIVKKYQGGHFNGMEDIYESDDDATFADVFGSPQYVFCQRSYGDNGENWEKPHEVIAKAYYAMYNMPYPADGVRARMENLNCWVSDFTGRVLRGSSFLPGVDAISGIQRDKNAESGFVALGWSTKSADSAEVAKKVAC